MNLGFGGSTLAACAHLFARLVPPCRPRSLLVYAGDNDRGDGRSPEEVLASLRSLLEQVDARLGPIPLAFLSIKPSPAREHPDDAIRRTNVRTRQAIAARPAGRFIDVDPRMLDGRADPARNSSAEAGSASAATAVGSGPRRPVSIRHFLRKLSREIRVSGCMLMG